VPFEKPGEWAALLKDLRKRFGMTQEQAASIAWVTVDAWKRWERPNVVPPLYVQRLILLLFDGLTQGIPSILIRPEIMESTSKAGLTYLKNLQISKHKKVATIRTLGQKQK
jgi:DNA-binding XRE family transcriptional regulator